MNKLFKNPFFYLLLVIIAIWAVAAMLSSGGRATKISSGEFQNHVVAGDVKKVVVYRSSGKLDGELKDGTKFSSNYLSPDTIAQLLADHPEIESDTNPENPSLWGSLLTSILPFIFILGIFFFLMQQMQGGGNRVMSFGKSKAKLVAKDQPKITFADVAGVDEAIEELEEIKEFLANPAKFQNMGAKIPKGVLLFGPPGHRQDPARPSGRR